MKILNLYGNLISEINSDTFRGIEGNIEYMNLGFNVIDKLQPLNYPSLRYLNVEKNRIKNITGIFNRLKNLQVTIFEVYYLILTSCK